MTKYLLIFVVGLVSPLVIKSKMVQSLLLERQVQQRELELYIEQEARNRLYWHTPDTNPTFKSVR